MRYSLSTLITACALASTSAFANTITFEGEVADQTCEVHINGTKDNAVVLLPTVSTSSLQGKAATAGQTPFTLSLTGCQKKDNETEIKIRFNGHRVTEGGNLGNATSNAAKNVAVQLLSDIDSIPPTAIDLKSETPVVQVKLSKDSALGSYQFAAQYISEDGNASAGKVTAVVEYATSYL